MPTKSPNICHALPHCCDYCFRCSADNHEPLCSVPSGTVGTYCVVKIPKGIKQARISGERQYRQYCLRRAHYCSDYYSLIGLRCVTSSRIILSTFYLLRAVLNIANAQRQNIGARDQQRNFEGASVSRNHRGLQSESNIRADWAKGCIQATRLGWIIMFAIILVSSNEPERNNIVQQYSTKDTCMDGSPETGS